MIQQIDLTPQPFVTPTRRYIGTPTKQFEEVNDYLNTQYNENRDKIDLMSSTLSQIQTHSKDEHIKRAAIDSLKGDIAPLQETGEYEHATGAVRDASNKIISNESLRNAVRTSAEISAYNTTLLKAKEDGTISADDYHKAKALSEYKYKGLQKNQYGIYDGAYNGYVPAKYFDTGAFIETHIKNFMEDKFGIGTPYQRVNDKYVATVNGTRTEVDSRQVETYIKGLLQTDEMYNAHRNSQNILNFYDKTLTHDDGIKTMTLDGKEFNPKANPVDILKEKAIKYQEMFDMMKAKNPAYSDEEIVKSIVYQNSTQADINKTAYLAGVKAGFKQDDINYTLHDDWSSKMLYEHQLKEIFKAQPNDFYFNDVLSLGDNQVNTLNQKNATNLVTDDKGNLTADKVYYNLGNNSIVEGLNNQETQLLYKYAPELKQLKDVKQNVNEQEAVLKKSPFYGIVSSKDTPVSAADITVSKGKNFAQKVVLGATNALHFSSDKDIAEYNNYLMKLGLFEATKNKYEQQKQLLPTNVVSKADKILDAYNKSKTPIELDKLAKFANALKTPTIKYSANNTDNLMGVDGQKVVKGLGTITQNQLLAALKNEGLDDSDLEEFQKAFPDAIRYVGEVRVPTPDGKSTSEKTYQLAINAVYKHNAATGSLYNKDSGGEHADAKTVDYWNNASNRQSQINQFVGTGKVFKTKEIGGQPLVDESVSPAFQNLNKIEKLLANKNLIGTLNGYTDITGQPIEGMSYRQYYNDLAGVVRKQRTEYNTALDNTAKYNHLSYAEREQRGIANSFFDNEFNGRLVNTSGELQKFYEYLNTIK